MLRSWRRPGGSGQGLCRRPQAPPLHHDGPDDGFHRSTRAGRLSRLESALPGADAARYPGKSTEICVRRFRAAGRCEAPLQEGDPDPHGSSLAQPVSTLKGRWSSSLETRGPATASTSHEGSVSHAVPGAGTPDHAQIAHPGCVKPPRAGQGPRLEGIIWALVRRRPRSPVMDSGQVVWDAIPRFRAASWRARVKAWLVGSSRWAVRRLPR